MRRDIARRGPFLAVRWSQLQRDQEMMKLVVTGTSYVLVHLLMMQVKVGVAEVSLYKEDCIDNDDVSIEKHVFVQQI